MQTSSEVELEATEEERLGAFLSTLADQSFHDSEELDAEIAALPDPLEQRVRSFKKRLEQLTGLEERARQDLLDEYTRAARGAYIESMTGLPNRRFVHDHLSSLFGGVVRAVRKGKTTEALSMARSRAFVSFDLDGLKVVNDLAGQKSGDDYIKLFGQVLLGAAQALELENEGMHVEAARDGGDEFSLIIDWPGHEVDLKEIDSIVQLVQEVFAARNVRHIINLHDVTEGLEKKGLILEKGFTFRPSVSGGGTSFYDALRVHAGAKNVESGYRDTLASLAGFARDLGGIHAKKVKTRMRGEMHVSTDPNEQFMAKLFDQFRPVGGEEQQRSAELEKRLHESNAALEKLMTIVTVMEKKYATLEVQSRNALAEKDKEIAAIRTESNQEKAAMARQIEALLLRIESMQPKEYGKQKTG